MKKPKLLLVIEIGISIVFLLGMYLWNFTLSHQSNRKGGHYIPGYIEVSHVHLIDSTWICDTCKPDLDNPNFD